VDSQQPKHTSFADASPTSPSLIHTHTHTHIHGVHTHTHTYTIIHTRAHSHSHTQRHGNPSTEAQGGCRDRQQQYVPGVIWFMVPHRRLAPPMSPTTYRDTSPFAICYSSMVVAHHCYFLSLPTSRSQNSSPRFGPSRPERANNNHNAEICAMLTELADHERNVVRNIHKWVNIHKWSNPTCLPSATFSSATVSFAVHHPSLSDACSFSASALDYGFPST